MNQPNNIVFVALDFDEQRKNLEFAERISKEVDMEGYGFKINLDSVMSFSPEAHNPFYVVQSLQNLGRPVFVDLKMYNGGRTMENIAKGLADMGVYVFNLHISAGEKYISKLMKALHGTESKLIGVTVPTHYTDAQCMEMYGKSYRESVSTFAAIGERAGIDGFVVGGTALDLVVPYNKINIVPAVRPTWYEDKKANDQEQTSTPTEAMHAGATHLVVGSPIYKTENPGVSLMKILQEVDNAKR